MIDGVNLSEILEVQQTHMNHYQKLDSIINNYRNPFSLMSRNLERVIHGHNTIHVRMFISSKIGKNTSIKVLMLMIIRV
jgi:flagellar biosynthesis chaperone FliJ